MVDVSLRRAIENIATWGDTDIFPLPPENHVFHDQPDEVLRLLKTIHDDIDVALARRPPVNINSLVLVGYSAFRWATQIDPIWNAYLLGILIELAPAIEAARIPLDRKVVFSYRYEWNNENKSLFRSNAWAEFQERSSELAEAHANVLVCDIADFYHRIYHHRLENALTRVGSKTDIPSRIMKIQSAFSGTRSYGLPVGGPASRLLSELLLNSVDRLLMSEGISFCRYADDYHIFTQSEDEAHDALYKLSEKLLTNEGLSLQRGKTRLLTAKEFVSTRPLAHTDDGAAEREFIAFSWRFDPYSPSAVEDYAVLKAQVEHFDISGMLTRELNKTRVHPALTRRLIRALRFMDPLPRDNAVLSLIENLPTLAPVFTDVMRALRLLFEELSSSVQESISERLRLMFETESFLVRAEVNRAYALRVLALDRSAENEELFARMYGYAGQIIKHDIVLAMARWNVAYWVSDRLHYFYQEQPWVQRALLIASYCLGDEGRHWRQAISPGLAEYEKLLKVWVSQRVQHAGWSVPL